MRNLTRLLYLLLIVFILQACSSDDDENPPSFDNLESFQYLFGRSESEISNLVSAAGLGDLVQYLDYGIQIYEISYKTEYLGQEVIATGLVTFPDTDDSVPMMSFQHGTIVAHDDAPTEDISTYSLLSSVAGAGYIFLIPDMIGFGGSTDILHPYYHAESTGRSIVDMLKAASELATAEGYNFDGNVFLSGYSEGGFATMAAHKTMEEEMPSGLNLVASAPASGGYDVKGMQEYFFSLDTYDNPFYLAFVAMSYQQTYSWDEPLSLYFQEPYATDIPGYFDGSLSNGEINNLLTTTIADYLQPDLLANIDTDPQFADLVDAFEENSLDDWVPTIRMLLYHGTSDSTVIYQNSVDTYERMLNLGASPNVVTFTPLPDEDHGSGFLPYLYDLIEEFEALKVAL